MTQDVLLKKEICKNFMLPNEKLPQAEGAAVRYVKAVRLLEKQSGLRDGAGWERAWMEWGERVHDWHMSAFSRAFWNYPNYTLPFARIEGVDLEKQGFPYAINQIRSTRSLFNEGRMLQHCVFSYHSHCREGRCYIFSMKVRR